MEEADHRTADVGWVLRLTRSMLLSAVTLSVAAWAHTSASGRLPNAGALVMIAFGATLLVAPLLGQPASYRRIVGLVVGGQFGLHLLLSLLAGHATPAVAGASAPHSVPAMAGHAGHTGHAEAMTHAGHAEAMTHAGHASAVTTGLSQVDEWRMVAAHLGASVLVGVWLATGERLLWCCLRRIAAAARRGYETVRWAVSSARRPLVVTACRLTREWLVVGPDVRSPDWLATSPHRGPPKVAVLS